MVTNTHAHTFIYTYEQTHIDIYSHKNISNSFCAYIYIYTQTPTEHTITQDKYEHG